MSLAARDDSMALRAMLPPGHQVPKVGGAGALQNRAVQGLKSPAKDMRGGPPSREAAAEAVGLLDERYFFDAHNNNNISTGAPTNARLTARVKF